MLSEILSQETCGKCRFCCSFRRKSLWEVPLFPPRYTERPDFQQDTVQGAACARMNLIDRYQTDDPEEEVPCLFLHRPEGCTLLPEEKPMECKLWPIRVMKTDDGALVLALSPSCPAVRQIPIDKVQTLASSFASEVWDYADANPYMIKPFVQGYPVLVRRNPTKG